ncbi:hypothetical protein RS130_13930 [Paraglaciecola aquimarina]|uniref:Uncharacterized protein n=1 Tax=Paraglaciecola aquimarina TaxID=1235557 RepID=A0ABU3SXX9_9ALTE|nr:hypothetical protein [Paraglaciecola aquimarina]MDU0354863.1 hypothetical protein [Paraglaciecola aquimarina]
MTVLIILGVLFVALVVLVPLIEKSNFNLSNEQMSKFSRWILPLLVISVVIQLIMHYTG